MKKQSLNKTAKKTESNKCEVLKNENILCSILDLLNYDDLDENEKLNKLRLLLNKDVIKAQNDLLTLKDYVKTDIEAGNFELNNPCVADSFYKTFLNL